MRADRCLATRFANGISDHARDKLDRTDRIVVTGNGHRDEIGIGIGIANGNDRDAELVGFGNRNALLLCVDNKEEPRNARHVLDARQILGELVAQAREQELFFLRVVLEVAARFGSGFQFLEALGLLLDRLEVGKKTA